MFLNTINTMGGASYVADVMNLLFDGDKYDDRGDDHNWYDDDCWMPQ